MKLKLSHSQANKFQDCGTAWHYHYRQRIRPITKSSALFFGNILDAAVEDYLNNRDTKQAQEILKSRWEEGDINGKKVKLYDCTDIVYSNADFDTDLLEDEDWNTLKEEHGDHVKEQITSIYKQKKVIGYENLKHGRKILLNKANWWCMLRKGLLMLDKAIELIDENVEEVLGTQVEVNLDNGVGDSIIGYADFVVKWKGYDEPIVFDLKTSSIEYHKNSAKRSAQLCLYLHDLRDKFNTNTVGYMVLHKRVLKDKVKKCSKCGYDGTGTKYKTCSNEVDGVRCKGEWNESVSCAIRHQIIIDQPSKAMEEMIIENMDAVAKSIKAEIITKNLNACEKPWGKCPYYSLCYKEADSLGEANLIEVPKEDKENDNKK